MHAQPGNGQYGRVRVTEFEVATNEQKGALNVAVFGRQGPVVVVG